MNINNIKSREFFVLKGGGFVIVHVYAICWNEEKMLPYFFKYYDNIADQYYIFDNGSTDNSLSLLGAHPKVNIDTFEVTGNSFVISIQNLFNEFWKSSVGKADWVIVTDIDEHMYHPNLRSYLQECRSKGVTYVPSKGYEMVSDFFPNSVNPLHETITHGARTPLYDKPQIFNPNEIREINFVPGRHQASPIGNVIKPPNIEVLLLHYKYLGFDYVNGRNTTLKKGLREGDIKNQYGIQYLWDEKQRFEVFQNLKSNSEKVL